jgi:predicted aminopeptidase
VHYQQHHAGNNTILIRFENMVILLPRRSMQTAFSVRRLVFCILLSITPAGCESLQYYGHVINGHAKILNNRQSIKQLIADPQTATELKGKLKRILEIREFAENQLFLPVNNHYRTYTELNRPYVTWNVYAAPEFSLTAKTWAYPVIGRAAYRGYYVRSHALSYAERLQNNGYDVYVGGATAYSTLGWFEDSVFSTFIARDESQLAALIFHELAHQVLYVRDDTTFNESFATAVEQAGLRRWMIYSNNPNGLKKYLANRERHRQFVELVKRYRFELDSLYRKDIPRAVKRHQKASVFRRLKTEYDHTKLDWDANSAYDDWFNTALNNAKLISVAAYYDLVPEFLRLLQSNHNDLRQFYAACRQLAKLPKAERDRSLK